MRDDDDVTEAFRMGYLVVPNLTPGQRVGTRFKLISMCNTTYRLWCQKPKERDQKCNNYVSSTAANLPIQYSRGVNVQLS